MSSQVSPSKEFLDYKKDANTHGLLMSLSFLVVFPTGILIARYMRTYSKRWFYAHWIINGLLGLPLILTGAYMGSKAHRFGYGSLTTHGKHGLLIIGLCLGQVVLGLIIHFIPMPFPFFGRRPPQNFVHAVQGLLILSLANYQVYKGIHEKASLYLATDVLQSVKRAWLALVIIFWSLYAIGLIFLRRQYKQEREAAQQKGQVIYPLRTSSTP